MVALVGEVGAPSPHGRGTGQAALRCGVVVTCAIMGGRLVLLGVAAPEVMVVCGGVLLWWNLVHGSSNQSA